MNKYEIEDNENDEIKDSKPKIENELNKLWIKLNKNGGILVICLSISNMMY